MLFVNVYVDADKYCMEACQNHVMDFFLHNSLDLFPHPWTIVELGKRGLRTCKLRKFLIHDLCFRMKDYIWDMDTIVDGYSMQLIAAGDNDAEDMFTACMKRNTEADSSDHPGTYCDWHTHNTTEICI